MPVKDYIEEHFTDIEKDMFNYIVDSFPENMLIVDGEESEYILFMLASLAKVLGNAKELIINLKNAHSISGLLDLIEDGKLLEHNRNLLLPLAKDLKYSRANRIKKTSKLIDDLIKERPFLENSYLLLKNRGTRLSIRQVIRAFETYYRRTEGLEPIGYYINDSKNPVEVVFDFLEGYADYEEYDTYEDESGNEQEAFRIRPDTILYDQIMRTKPAGIIYSILIKELAGLLYNLLSDRIIAPNSALNIVQPEITGATLYEPVLEDISSTEDNKYYGNITNQSSFSSFDLYIADWHDASIGSSSFPNIIYRWEPCVEVDAPTDWSYVYRTRSEMEAALEDSDPGDTVVLTGYSWEATSFDDYTDTPASNRLEFSGVEAASRATINSQKLPQYSLWNRYNGNVVVRWHHIDIGYSYWRLVEHKPGGFTNSAEPQLTIAFYYSTGKKGFSYSKYIVPPLKTIEVDVESTDPDFGESSRIYAYFTYSGSPSQKSNTSEKLLSADFEVTFHGNGVPDPSTRYVEDGDHLVEPEISRTGYTLTGWYTDEALTSQWDFDTDTVTENLDLYAGWDINTYTISYYDEDGETLLDTVDQDFDEIIDPPEDPIKTNYLFIGWYYDLEYTMPLGSSDTVDGDTSLYAEWEIEPTSVSGELTFEGSAEGYEHLSLFQSVSGELMFEGLASGYQKDTFSTEASGKLTFEGSAGGYEHLSFSQSAYGELTLEGSAGGYEYLSFSQSASGELMLEGSAEGYEE